MTHTKAREIIKSRLQNYADIRCSFLIEKVVTVDRINEDFIDEFTTKLLDISMEEVKNFVGEEDFTLTNSADTCNILATERKLNNKPPTDIR